MCLCDIENQGFIKGKNPLIAMGGWGVVFVCFHCILRGKVSKSGSHEEIGEGVLVKVGHARFGNIKPVGLSRPLLTSPSLITLIPRINK